MEVDVDVVSRPVGEAFLGESVTDFAALTGDDSRQIEPRECQIEQ